jgi:hypothetical protein
VTERQYYKTWQEANAHRQKGERIYYKPKKGYYIVKPKKKMMSFDLIIKATRSVIDESNRIGNRIGNKRGRKPYPRHVLLAIAYMMEKLSWSYRQAEDWCLQNYELLMQYGCNFPPRKSILQKFMSEIDASLLHKVGVKIKQLKGEIRGLPY